MFLLLIPITQGLILSFKGDNDLYSTKMIVKTVEEKKTMVVFNSDDKLSSFAYLEGITSLGEEYSTMFEIYNGRILVLPKGTYTLRVRHAAVHGQEFDSIKAYRTITQTTVYDGSSYQEIVRIDGYTETFSLNFDIEGLRQTIKFRVPTEIVNATSTVTSRTLLPYKSTKD
jgi:hypothetical protein